MPYEHTIAANSHWLPMPTRGSIDHLPGDDGFPLIGNTLRVLRDPIGFTERMVARHGPVYRNNAFGGPSAVLIGPEANELVLFDRDQLFSSEQGWGPLLNLLFPRGLMLMDFERHRADRRVMSVAFKPLPMRHYAEQLNEGIAQSVAAWPASLRLYDAMKSLSLDLAAGSFLGVPLGEDADLINRAFVDEVQASVAPIRIPLPGTAMRRGVTARRYLVERFRSEIPRRRKGDGKRLLLDLLPRDGRRRAAIERGRDRGSHELPDDGGARHHHVVRHRSDDAVGQASRMAVEAAFGDRGRKRRSGLGAPSRISINSSLCEQAFKEALRLMPPVPAIARRALRDFSFGGYDIPAGTFIGVNPAYTHRMAEHWPEPDEFDPMRFTADASRGRHRFAWVPFGGGAHMCIGLHFATMQIRILLAHLLSRYEIELAPGSGISWQVFPIPRPRDGLPVRLNPLAR